MHNPDEISDASWESRNAIRTATTGSEGHASPPYIEEDLQITSNSSHFAGSLFGGSPEQFFGKQDESMFVLTDSGCNLLEKNDSNMDWANHALLCSQLLSRAVHAQCVDLKDIVVSVNSGGGAKQFAMRSRIFRLSSVENQEQPCSPPHNTCCRRSRK